MLPHGADEQQPSGMVRRAVRAHDALALPCQLGRCRPMDIDAEPLAEPTDARAIRPVAPDGSTHWIGIDFMNGCVRCHLFDCGRGDVPAGFFLGSTLSGGFRRGSTLCLYPLRLLPGQRG